MATDSAYRGVWWLSLRRPNEAFQIANATRANRYPRIFVFVQSQLGSDFEGRILSFGCSTGEEVFTLRRYFPRAFLKGIDINPGNIARCRLRMPQTEARMTFEVASSTAGEDEGAYDAIFCMAVLRHHTLNDSDARCDHVLRFDDFERAVEDLARCLKPGALLVIRHSNFRLCDTSAGARFETLFRLAFHDANRSPVYGADNRLMPGIAYEDTVFRLSDP